MRKLKALKVGGVQREEKLKKTQFMNWKKKKIVMFSLFLFISTSKMIFRA
jgi:hypothetical protein